MDDNIIKHYSNEDTFQIQMEEMGGMVKLTLTEIWMASSPNMDGLHASVSLSMALEVPQAFHALLICGFLHVAETKIFSHNLPKSYFVCAFILICEVYAKLCNVWNENGGEKIHMPWYINPEVLSHMFCFWNVKKRQMPVVLNSLRIWEKAELLIAELKSQILIFNRCYRALKPTALEILIFKGYSWMHAVNGVLLLLEGF